MTFTNHSFCNKHFTFINKTFPAKKNLTNVSRETFILIKRLGNELSDSQYPVINIQLSIVKYFPFQNHLRFTYNPNDPSFLT